MSHDDLADRLFVAIGEGDAATISACLADDVVVWTSFDDAEAERPQVLKLLAWMHSTIAGLSYEIVRREDVPGGFVQQHVLHGTGPSGAVIAMPACVIAAVVDGRVSRMEEYLDPAPLMNALT